MKYAWVDTCCIDKSSSAELSESINSMFKWYRQATTCYAYLEDVDTHDPADFKSPDSSLSKSRWFRRGWTLQELVAPRNVTFYNAKWEKIGDKKDHVLELEAITGIDPDVLGGKAPQAVPIAWRMSWAADRETTRIEDVAYSLLGIFDINMPLLYGEGPKPSYACRERSIARLTTIASLRGELSPASLML